ncbi:MAG: RNA polymerase factor sigma-54 [Ignavibacteria bacterium]|nr:RNA polymerase factor sigma-54 [Ignavibacteria bacterium]
MVIQQEAKLTFKNISKIIQRQNLLTVPALAMEELIRAELEVNPFLEEGELQEDIKGTENGYEDLQESVEEKEKREEEYDIEDFTDGDLIGYKTEESEFQSKDVNYENIWKERITIYDSLKAQLRLTNLSDKQIYIGEEIIGNLDNEGYFRENIGDFTLNLNKLKKQTEFENETITEDEVEEVLKEIQNLEPPGIAARNLQECLINQLKVINLEENFKTLCIQAVTEHIYELRLKNYENLAAELNTDIETVNRIFEQISKLDPKPGLKVEAMDNQSVCPDLIVRKEEGIYKIDVNERNVPNLRLNTYYKKLINRRDIKKKEDREKMREKLQRAQWFIDAIKLRKETLIIIMELILRKQIEFFENNGKGLKPLYEKEIVAETGLDKSTVSRAVKGKYVQTPFGIYELRYFFGYNYKNKENEDISVTEIKNKLKEIILSENSTVPFTDAQLVKKMEDAGYKIARRTIAKYRESLNIPVAKLRRKL